MKKRVRIYKSPNGVGKHISKLSKFIAQAGGEQNKQSQIYDYVYKVLNDAEPFEFNTEKESLINELSAAQIPIDQAEQIVEDIASQLESETMQAQQIAGMDQVETPEEEVVETPVEEEEEDLASNYDYYEDTPADGEDDEDDEDYDDSEAYMQDGGPLIPQANTVSISGLTPEDYVANNQYAFGGNTKRKFVNSVMKMLKKQAGGVGEQVEDKTDQFNIKDTADNKVSNMNKGFITALANNAQEAKIKEKAEAIWQQQQAMMQQQVPQYPMQAPMEEVPMAQYGMSVRQMRRMMPKGFSRGQMRSFAGWVPQGGMFPLGMNIMTYPLVMPEQKPIHVQGTMPGMKLDVRKSHWLTGRPSQYSLEFGGDFAIPGFGSLPGGGTGYKSTNRRKIEGTSRIVNKAADPAKNNESTLLNKDDKSYDKDNNGVPDSIQSNPVVLSTRDSQYDKNKNNQLDVTEVATNLPGVVTNTTNTTNKTTNTTNTVNTTNTSNKTTSNKTTETKTAPKKSTPITNKTVLANSSPKKETKTVDYSKVTESKPTSSVKKPNFSNPSPLVKKPVLPKGAKAIPTAENTDPFYMQALKKIGNVAGDYYDKALWALSDWGYQQGGFIDSSNPDLYKFIYGGNDPITQQDMDYSDSKNSASPYFEKGGMLKKYGPGDEVKGDDYDKYLREKAEADALAEYNAYMNRAEADKTKHQKYTANTNDSIYNKILALSQSKYGVKTNQNQNKSNDFAPITSKEDYDKRLAEERKKWQTEYDTSDYYDNSGSYNYGYGSNYGIPNYFGKYFPANTIRKLGTWSQQKGMPYDVNTGNPYMAGFGPNTRLNKIDVRKSGWLSGDPRKYTMYFTNEEADPTKPQFSINDGTTQGTGRTNFGEDELDTRKERREARRYNKLMDDLNSNYAPSETEDETDVDMDKAPVRPMSEIPLDKRYSPDLVSAKRDIISAENLAENPMGNADYASVNQMMQDQELAKRMAQNDMNSAIVGANPANMTQEEAAQALLNSPLFNSASQSPNVINPSAEDINRRDAAVLANKDIQREFSNEDPFGIGMSSDYEENIDDYGKQPAINPETGQLKNEVVTQDFEGQDYESGDYDNASLFPGGTGSIADQANAYAAMMQQNQNPTNLPNVDLSANPFPFSSTDVNDELAGYGWSRNGIIDPKAYKKQQEALLKKRNEEAKRKAEEQKNQLANRSVNTNRSVNSNRQGDQSGNWTGTWDIKGVINKNKDQLETLIDSPTGSKTLYAIDSRWQNMSEAQRKKYGSFDKYLKTEGYDKFYNVMQGKTSNIAKNKKKKQFGGTSDPFETTYNNLQSFIPSYNPGGPTNTNNPVVYTNNPALQGMSDVDITTNNANIAPDLQQSSFWNDQQSFNQPTMTYQEGCTEDQKKDPTSKCYDVEKYGMKIQEDALGSARELIKKTYAPKAGDFAIDFKNKNAYEIDAQGTLLSANALANAYLDRRNKRQRDRAEALYMYNNQFADTKYASDPSRQFGNYETNSGLFRPNVQGQTFYSQKGGPINYNEGDEVMMTPEQLKSFLDNGGEVEYI